MDTLAGSLDNLALGATGYRTTLQQLKLANLSLTTSVAMLMATNKKLTKTVACCNLAHRDMVAAGDAVATALNVVPKQFGKTTVGHTGTARSCILARPAM
jgi:hypothetical protein